jgi:hypothetical protein
VGVTDLFDQPSKIVNSVRCAPNLAQGFAAESAEPHDEFSRAIQQR